jgi:hypothetical protein
MASATRICSADMRKNFPPFVQVPEQGTSLGGNLGECAGNTYAAVHKSKYVDSQACAAALKKAMAADQAVKR